MTHWTDDTWLDKAFRFLIGAFIGAGGAWGAFAKWNLQSDWEYVAVAMAFCLTLGGLCLIFGNKFIEAMVLGGRK